MLQAFTAAARVSLLQLGRPRYTLTGTSNPAHPLTHPQPLGPPAMASRGEVLPADGGFKVRGALLGPPPPDAAAAAAVGPTHIRSAAASLPCFAPQAVFQHAEQQHTVAPLPSAEAAALVLDVLEGEGPGVRSYTCLLSLAVSANRSVQLAAHLRVTNQPCLLISIAPCRSAPVPCRQPAPGPSPPAQRRPPAAAGAHGWVRTAFGRVYDSVLCRRAWDNVGDYDKIVGLRQQGGP